MVLGSAKKLGTSNVICAEASGLRVGLQAALVHGHKNLEVEGDSKILIDSINDKCKIPWRIKILIQDIKILAS